MKLIKFFKQLDKANYEEDFDGYMSDFNYISTSWWLGLLIGIISGCYIAARLPFNEELGDYQLIKVKIVGIILFGVGGGLVAGTASFITRYFKKRKQL